MLFCTVVNSNVPVTTPDSTAELDRVEKLEHACVGRLVRLLWICLHGLDNIRVICPHFPTQNARGRVFSDLLHASSCVWRDSAGGMPRAMSGSALNRYDTLWPVNKTANG